MEPRNQQVVMTRRANLMSLQRHAGWQELITEVERRRGRDIKALISAALAGEDIENLKAQIDYLRGWEAALHWVISIPGGAEASLERLLNKERQEA
jgi:hypothetical protein